jgi:RND superfamily putative drug exporter
MLKILTHLAQRQAWLIVVAAVLLTIGAGVYGAGVFSHLNSDEGFESKNTQSSEVVESLKNDFPKSQASAVILFSSKDGHTLDNAIDAAEVQRLLDPLKNDTSLLATYWSTGQDSFLSKDNKQTYAAVTVKGNGDAQYRRLARFADETKSDRLTVNVGGGLVAQKQSSEQVKRDLEMAEIISLPLLALLLVLVFRGLVAAAMPLMLGVVAIAGGLAVVRLLTNLTSIDQYAINVITVLGLGLSVDYSLLMVSRFREELQRQPDVPAAVRHTVMTSGRTIFFSGLTVIISLLALSLFPIEFLRSISLGGVAALLVAIGAALTVLPASLRLLGHRINALRLGPKPGKTDGPTFWGRVNTITSRFPLLTIVAAVAIILAAAMPFWQVHYLAFDFGALPAGSSAREVGEALQTNFGSQDANVTVLYRPDDASIPPAAAAAAQAQAAAAVARARAARMITTAAQAQAAQLPAPLPQQVSDMRQRLEDMNEVTAVDRPVASKDGQEFKLVAHYHEDDSGMVGRSLVTAIRDLKQTNGPLRVGGGAAEVVDTVATIGHYLPYAAAVIVIAMGLLLGLMLRSILIPIQAIALSGFGLLASFGALVWIFQQGHLTSWTWFARTDGLSPTILLLVFTMAFGLSMDYATFLYSRMREEYDKGRENRAAIHGGVERTGYIITAAAVLMFVVVAAFASSKIPMLQQVGLGMALAVIVDAFVVRILLVPAVMLLLGRANWYAPKWLARWQIRHD